MHPGKTHFINTYTRDENSFSIVGEQKKNKKKQKKSIICLYPPAYAWCFVIARGIFKNT